MNFVLEEKLLSTSLPYFKGFSKITKSHLRSLISSNFDILTFETKKDFFISSSLSPLQKGYFKLSLKNKGNSKFEPTIIKFRK